MTKELLDSYYQHLLRRFVDRSGKAPQTTHFQEFMLFLLEYSIPYEVSAAASLEVLEEEEGPFPQPGLWFEGLASTFLVDQRIRSDEGFYDRLYLSVVSPLEKVRCEIQLKKNVSP